MEGCRHKSENNGNNGPSVLENNGNNRTIHRPEGRGIPRPEGGEADIEP